MYEWSAQTLPSEFSLVLGAAEQQTHCVARLMLLFSAALPDACDPALPRPLALDVRADFVLLAL